MALPTDSVTIAQVKNRNTALFKLEEKKTVTITGKFWGDTDLAGLWTEKGGFQLKNKDTGEVVLKRVTEGDGEVKIDIEVELQPGNYELKAFGESESTGANVAVKYKRFLGGDGDVNGIMLVAVALILVLFMFKT